MKLLAKALGKNLDETAVVLHLVLHNILTTSPTTQQGETSLYCMYIHVFDVYIYILTLTLCVWLIGGVVLSTLRTKYARSEWEKQFGQNYIYPLLEVHTHV